MQNDRTERTLLKLTQYPLAGIQHLLWLIDSLSWVISWKHYFWSTETWTCSVRTNYRSWKNWSMSLNHLTCNKRLKLRKTISISKIIPMVNLMKQINIVIKYELARLLLLCENRSIFKIKWIFIIISVWNLIQRDKM